MTEKEPNIAGTLNLWENSFWEKRREVLPDRLREAGFTSGEGVVLALQEVRRAEFDVLMEIAKALNFNQDQIHYFPTNYSKDYGMAILTDLPVQREELVLLTQESRGGARAIAMLEIPYGDSKITAGVTHFDFTEAEQLKQGIDSLGALKRFIIDGLNVSEDEKGELLNGGLSNLFERSHIILAGDFNAAPDSALYREFQNSGLTDWTKPLRPEHQYTWPWNIDEFIKLHVERWGKPPLYEIDQRWVDYIWGNGFSAQPFLFAEGGSDHYGVGAKLRAEE